MKTNKTKTQTASKSKTSSVSKVSQKDLVAMTSSAIEDVWFGIMGDDFKKFGSRMEDAQKVDDTEVKALLSKIERKYGAKEVNAIIKSPAGLRTLLDIETPAELAAYCQLINLTKTELEGLLSNEEIPASHFSNMALVAAIGVWSQSVREQIAKGLAVNSEMKETAEMAFSALGASESFITGRNLAKRIWNGIILEKKKGRRADNYMDQYFKNENNAEMTTAVGE